MAILLASGAISLLSSAVTSTGQMTLTISSPSSDRFPNQAGEYYVLVADANVIYQGELMKVQGVRAGTVLTVIARGVGGTTARTFAVGAKVTYAMPREALDEYFSPSIAGYGDYPTDLPVAPVAGMGFFAKNSLYDWSYNGSSWIPYHRGTGIQAKPIDFASWTAYGFGGSTISRPDGNYVKVLQNGSSSSSVTSFRTNPVVLTGNYTITLRIGPWVSRMEGDVGIGLFLHDTVSDKVKSFFHHGNGFITVNNHNNPSSYNSQPYINSGGGLSKVYPSASGYWLRIRNDGTNWFFEYSMNGLEWFTIYSQAVNTFLTPTNWGIGVYVSANNDTEIVNYTILHAEVS